MEINVVTLNLRTDTAQDGANHWKFRKEQAAAFINETRPLILSTQEGSQEMIQDLLALCKDYQYIGVPRTLGNEYNAIFYRTDLAGVRESGTFWLSKTPTLPESRDFNSACTRICTFGEFYVLKNPTVRFRVYNTHLDHQSETARVEGIKIIAREIAGKNAREMLPVVLTGDFNATPDSPVIKYINSTKLFRSVLNDGGTFHAFTGKAQAQIDYIFVSAGFSVSEAAVLPHFISDHFPVRAGLSLTECFVRSNYHSHIYRCNHATGDVDDYIEQAKKLGFRIIGISDHIPNDNLDEFRMKEKELKDYHNALQKAKRTFNDIEIYGGLECEYITQYHDYITALKTQFDYLVLGQHVVEYQNRLISYEMLDTPELMMIYADTIVRAMATGLFAFVAHPDAFGLSYQNNDEAFRLASVKIIEGAVKYNVPLEINANGYRRHHDRYREHYPYPLEAFWEIASHYPNLKVIINSDAHEAGFLFDEAVLQAYALAEKYGLTVIDRLRF